MYSAVFRRHLLWVGLNVTAATIVYCLLQYICWKIATWLGVQHKGHNIIDFLQYVVVLTLSMVYVYISYNSDMKRFGSTSVIHNAVKNAMWNVLLAVVLGVVFGKCLADQLDMLPATFLSVVNIFSSEYVVPMLACGVSIWWIVFQPSIPWALQEKPLPIGTAFGAQIVETIQKAFPRCLVLSMTLSLMFLVLRTAEHILLTWMCPTGDTTVVPALTGSSVVCQYVGENEAVFPVYLPNSSIWNDFLVSMAVSFIVTVQLEVVTQSLSYMTTYPLDFQKLQQSTKQQSGSASSSTNSEDMLVQALQIGAQTTTSAGRASQQTIAASTSAQYTALSASASVEEQDHQHSLLVASIIQLPAQPPILPFFGEGVSTLEYNSKGSHSTLSTSAASSPGPSILTPLAVSLLTRSLAFQDLHRIASKDNAAAGKRRSVLYAQHWEEVVAACCKMIDAATLQIHMLNKFLTETPQPSTATVTAPVATVTALSESKKSTSFENIVRLRAQLSASDLHQRTAGSNSSVSSSNSSTAVEIEKNPTAARSAQRVPNSDPLSDAFLQLQRLLGSNEIVNALVDQVSLRYSALLDIPVPGRGVEHAGTLPFRAVPPMCAATVAYATRSVSLLLVHALAEDRRGITQRSVCSVVRMLLHLEETVASYCATLQASQYVRIARMGRTQQIRYRARSESAVPNSVRVIQLAVTESISRLVSAYRDVLLSIVTNYDSTASSAMFSKAHMLALEEKLVTLSAQQ